MLRMLKIAGQLSGQDQCLLRQGRRGEGYTDCEIHAQNEEKTRRGLTSASPVC